MASADMLVATQDHIVKSVAKPSFIVAITSVVAESKYLLLLSLIATLIKRDAVEVLFVVARYDAMERFLRCELTIPCHGDVCLEYDTCLLKLTVSYGIPVERVVVLMFRW